MDRKYGIPGLELGNDFGSDAEQPITRYQASAISDSINHIYSRFESTEKMYKKLSERNLTFLEDRLDFLETRIERLYEKLAESELLVRDSAKELMQVKGEYQRSNALNKKRVDALLDYIDELED